MGSSASVNHLYDYRPNGTPLSPFTITYRSIIVFTLFFKAVFQYTSVLMSAQVFMLKYNFQGCH